MNLRHSYIKASWSIPEVLFSKTYHQVPNITLDVCEKFTSFVVEEDMTLPFIARYRREEVGNLTVEDLRFMKSSVEELQ